MQCIKLGTLKMLFCFILICEIRLIYSEDSDIDQLKLVYTCVMHYAYKLQS